ncbi:MAG: acyl-ACP--UDP-N-acetylglucosamine O-acyltransferase [Rikenellaceae bacterium]
MISNLAVVHPNAKLGEGVVVEPFAIIEEDVVIGDGTVIGPHAIIKDGTTIGKNCRIHSSAVIGGEPQDLKFRGEKTTVVIGDNNNIREFVTVNRGTAAKGVTQIGNNNLIMAYAHIGHDCLVGNNIVIVNRVSLAGEVEVDDWAIVAGHCGVHQFTKIGAHAMLGGLLKLSRDVPPYVRAAREPVSFVGINSIGLRRRGFSNEAITEIQDIYRILFQSNLAVSSAVSRIEEEFAVSEYRDTILDFIRNSKRGVIKSYQFTSISDSDDV